MILLQQMMALFFMMMIGYLCGKSGKLDGVAVKKISWLVVNVGNVALVLQAGMDNEITVKFENVAFMFGLAVFVYAVMMLLAIWIPVLLKVEQKNYGVYRVMFIFSNIGFMGMPLLSVLYGGESLLYASMFFFPYNILIYTYGVHAMKIDGMEREKFKWGDILNAGVISSVAGVVIYFSGIRMPSFVLTTVGSLSDITAPLSMIVIGCSFTEFKGKELITDVRLLFFSVIKLLVIPIAGTWLIMQFLPDPMMRGACMIMFSTPVGSMTAMLAQQYDGNYSLAAKGVAFTTILSVVTIPVVSAVTGV